MIARHPVFKLGGATADGVVHRVQFGNVMRSWFVDVLTGGAGEVEDVIIFKNVKNKKFYFSLTIKKFIYATS
jgi:hypothetical protein